MADSSKSFRTIKPRTKAALIIGFGGLLALIALSGVSTFSVFQEIHARNEAIREDFLLRNYVLGRIRLDVYLSGTYIRDFLLVPDPAEAEQSRRHLEETKNRIELALDSYRKLLRADETNQLRRFEAELASYWAALEPVLEWNAEERRKKGYQFVRTEVFRRRLTMLSLASQVGELNEKQLAAGDRQVDELFRQIQQRLLLFLLLTLLIGAVLAALSMRRILSLEQESEQQYREILQTRTELKELSARLVEAQETERRTISRELHDEVGQSLSALLLGLGNLSPVIVAQNDPALNDQFRTVRQLVERMMAVVRNMALLLRPSMLDDLGLIPALQWQAREVSRTCNIRVSVTSEGALNDVPDEHRTCIYRVVQEALHNCVKHAAATSIRVEVREQEDQLLLSIQDDGKGFSTRNEKGLGLLGMEERVTHLQGTFRVESQPGFGTLIAINLPLSQNLPATGIEA